jgi:hypothetical protein
MPNVYALSVVSASVAATTGGVGCEIESGARTTIRSIEVTWATGVTGVIGIGRPGNTPAGGTIVNPLPTDPADAATTGPGIITTGWTTAPTVPATFLKRASIAASLGSGVVWSFERDKWLVGATRANSLLVWVISLSAATATTFNISVEFAD